jgi:hypothetical protein
MTKSHAVEFVSRQPMASAVITLFVLLCGLAHAKDTKEYHTGVISSATALHVDFTPIASDMTNEVSQGRLCFGDAATGFPS